MCHAGTKSARPTHTPSSEPQCGCELTLTEPLRPYSLGSNRRSRSNGRNPSIPPTSHTPAARRGVPSTNSLAGFSNLHRLATREEWGRQDRGTRVNQARQQAAVRPMENSNTWRATLSLNPLSQRNLLLPSDAWSQKSLRDWIPSFQSLYSTPGRLSDHGFCDFLTSCMRQLKTPKIWRRALILAFPKPERALGDSKSYCPISLLCVSFKILERLICARVEPIMDQSL